MSPSKVAQRRGWFGAGPYYLEAHVRRYPGGLGWRGKPEYECVLARNHGGPIGASEVQVLLGIHAQNLGMSDSEKKTVGMAIHRLDDHRAREGTLKVIRRFARDLGMRIVVDRS